MHGGGEGGEGLSDSIAAAGRRRPADVLRPPGPDFPAHWPYSEEDLRRQDEELDTVFYDQPRFVQHIDDGAIAALSAFYAAAPVFLRGRARAADVLDIASSWVSHYPKGWRSDGRVVALGMVGAELKENEHANEVVVQDLNRDPKLPFGDSVFDAVTCAVSIDYLVRPVEVLREVRRVLKPGGHAYLSFSNRCFPTKVVGMWLKTNDAQHCWIVGSYFHYAEGFADAVVTDLLPTRERPRGTDPMFVIHAQKLPVHKADL